MRLVIASLVFALFAQTPSHAAKPTADELKARALYDDAVQRYDLAEYDKAIEEFKQVYLMTNRPELLFNLAQSHRAKHDQETALHFYQTYLKLKPEAPNRLEVRAFIVELEKALHERDIVRPTEKPPESAHVEPLIEAPKVAAPPLRFNGPPPQPPFFKTPRGKAVIAMMAVSAVSLFSAAAAGSVAISRRGSYDDSCSLGACNPALFSEGHSVAVVTDVLIAVGAATALTAVLVAVTRPKSARARDLASLQVRF